MKRPLSLLALCLLLGNTGISQQLLPMAEQAYTDSLNKAFQSAHTDSAKAQISFLLSDYWRSRDTAKSRSYLTRGENLAGDNRWLKALSTFYEGQFYFNTDKERAAAYFKEAQTTLQPFTSPVAYQTQAAAWFNYALMCRNEKGDEFVIDLLLNKAIPLSAKAGDPEKLAHYYVQLGALLMSNARFDKAELYNQKAIELLKGTNSTPLLFAYLSAVSTFVYDNKNDQAKVYLDKARDMLTPFPTSVNYPDFYYNEGLYYTGTGQLDKAMVSLDKGITLAEQYHQNAMLQNLIFRKYNIYLEQKDYKKANQFLLSLVDKNGQDKSGQMAEVGNRRTLYSQLAKTNEYLGDMKAAYHWSTLYSQLSDSLNGIRLKENIAELETKFRSSENEKKINALQAEKTRISLSARNSRLYIWLLGTICLFLLAIAVFSWSFLRQQKKVQQLKLTQAMLEGEERERKRIAQDLHDGLGGMLAGVKLNLSGWAAGHASHAGNISHAGHAGDTSHASHASNISHAGHAGDTSHTGHASQAGDTSNTSDTGNTGYPQDQELHKAKDLELHKIIGQLDRSVGELRHIARNMMPESLLKFGLETALKDLCEFYMREDVHLEFQPFAIPSTLPFPSQLNIYRIVQELLSNAVRHAQATNIILQCSQNGSVFFITVEDNGIGFDQGRLKEKKGLGLTNVRSRVEYMKGRMEVASTQGEGTTVNIELQIHAEQ